MSEFNKSASEGVAELKKLQEQKMQEAADGKSQEKGNGLVFTTCAHDVIFGTSHCIDTFCCIKL